MDAEIAENERIRELLVAALDGQLSYEQAEELAHVDPHLQKLAWLAAAQRIAELKARIDGPAKVDPSTPSGQRPIYNNPADYQSKSDRVECLR